MEIGDKIIKARKNADLTQNHLAELLGVSRQSLSNWENNRSYPDIVSVIKISDICKISLDSLLKNDEKMLRHLEESTNTVKAKSKYAKIIEIVSVAIIWLICIATLHKITEYQYLVVVRIIYYFIMPLTILISSTLIGKDFSKKEMVIVPFGFGIMYSLLAVFEYAFVEIGTKHDFMYVVSSACGPLMLWGIALSYLGILFGNKIFKNKV